MAVPHMLRSEAFGPDAELTILSWNVLAPQWAPPHSFGHVPKDIISWETRLPLIMDEIRRTSASIVCFQEVEFGLFEEEILPCMESLGYAGCMQSHKKKSPNHPAGNATFWLTWQLHLSEPALNRSRTLATILADTTGRHLAVVNCHLDAGSRKPVERVKHLQSSLQHLAGRRHHAVVLAGDFNCELGSSACAAYLAFGAVPEGVQEWGFEVPAMCRQVPPHGYALSSAYGPELVDEFSFTCRGTDVWFLDQLWFTMGALELRATRSTFLGPEHRQAIRAHGLPSSVDPSDHLPIAASFRWAGEMLPDLGIAALPQKEPPPLLPADPAAEAAELLAACPITDDQRTEWLMVSTMPTGKLSLEQLAEIKELRSRKQMLLEAVGEDVKAILVRYGQLMRKVKKR